MTQVNVSARQKRAQSHREQTCARQGGEEGRRGTGGSLGLAQLPLLLSGYHIGLVCQSHHWWGSLDQGIPISGPWTDTSCQISGSSRLEISEVKSLSRVRLFATPWMIAYQALWSMGFSRQEYWSGLPFPSLGDLPNLGIEPRSPALQTDTLPSEPLGKPV